MGKNANSCDCATKSRYFAPAATPNAALKPSLLRIQCLLNRGWTSGTPIAGQNIQDWKFAAYETPQAALMSGFWSMKEGQLAHLLNTYTRDERKRFESQAEGKQMLK